MENENIIKELVGKRREIVDYRVTNGTLKALKEALKEATKDNIFLSGTDKIKKLFEEDITDFVIGFKKTTSIYEIPAEDSDEGCKTNSEGKLVKEIEEYTYDIEYVSVDYQHREFYEMDLTTHDYRHLVEPFLRAINKIGGIEAMECID